MARSSHLNKKLRDGAARPVRAVCVEIYVSKKYFYGARDGCVPRYVTVHVTVLRVFFQGCEITTCSINFYGARGDCSLIEVTLSLHGFTIA